MHEIYYEKVNAFAFLYSVFNTKSLLFAFKNKKIVNLFSLTQMAESKSEEIFRKYLLEFNAESFVLIVGAQQQRSINRFRVLLAP